MIPFWVLNIVRHLFLGYPKRDHNFDNHPIKTPTVFQEPVELKVSGSSVKSCSNLSATNHSWERLGSC